MYTGPVGRLSTCPASSFLTTSPRGAALGLGAESAVFPHAASAAARTAAIAGTLSLEPLWAMMALKVIRLASVRQGSTAGLHTKSQGSPLSNHAARICVSHLSLIAARTPASTELPNSFGNTAVLSGQLGCRHDPGLEIWSGGRDTI